MSNFNLSYSALNNICEEEYKSQPDKYKNKTNEKAFLSTGRQRSDLELLNVTTQQVGTLVEKL